ncbi:Pantoate--beta-alanine ligase [Yarrowia sp. B02]|nr:Pantoate--beta-alanine ligase [Yarrowia sp. B02]
MLRSVFRQGVQKRCLFTQSDSCVRVFNTIEQVRAWRREKTLLGQSIGFVPTMGALHRGHLDLVKASIAENDHTIVSIFVNPSQFAPHEDFGQYPRTVESDVQKLTELRNQIQGDDKVHYTNEFAVFAPSVSEMYPSGIPLDVKEQVGAFIEVKGLSHQLEGSIRPHFFRGVATVVTKLLNIIQPDRAYFGQKDAQQCVVVSRLVADLHIPTAITIVPTTREANGLAMSSRNVYLTDESKEKSKVLYEALLGAKEVFNEPGVTYGDVQKKVLDVIAASEFKIDVEYVSVSDKKTLTDFPLDEKADQENGCLISAAVRVPNKEGAKTRIIDNVLC